MLLCVTPNPAIDRTVVVANLRLDDVNRAETVRVAAGGKGVNAARAARALGEPAICAGFVGGEHGALFTALATREGLRGHWTAISGETRSCLILLDPARGDNTVINEQGPVVTRGDWDRLIERVLELSTSATAVCLCGSAPPGTPLPCYAELLARLGKTGLPVWVDAAGEQLALAKQDGGVCLKVNRDEARALTGRRLAEVGDLAQAAHDMVNEGATMCVITLGGDGAVMASASGCWHATIPPIPRVNAVGSGDSFLAAIATAKSRGLPDANALSWGVAAGAANAASTGGGGFTREQFDELLSRVTLQSHT